jgi:predicted permease
MLMADVRNAIRSLRKSPGFTIVAISTIAIGIGANTALFSVYDRLVLNPVTIPDPASLVAIWSNNPQININAPAASWPRYEDIRAHQTTFTSVGISAFDNFTLTGNGDPEQLNGQRISASFFPTLGIRPALGRNFTPDEDLPNGPAVCLLSHELWTTRFGARPGIVGEAITLNGQSWQVVGIMPPQLSPPFRQVQIFSPRVFEIGGLTPLQVQNGSGYAQPIARLKSGVTLAQAAGDLAAISRGYQERFGGKLDASFRSEPHVFVDALVGPLQPTFYTLIGGVSFVLLIACANVASLFLGRLTMRQKEIAVRQSLGATRARLVSQLMVESLVFSCAAGAAGVLLAMWALSAIQSVVATQLPPNTLLTLNWRALAFTGGATLLTSVLVGLAPALHASRTPLVEMLKDRARGSSGQRGGRFRATLIIAEVALSIVLLVGSSLLLMSFVRLQNTSPGFEAKGAAAAFVAVPAARYGTLAQRAQFFNDVIERLAAQPQVTSAAVALGLPLSGFNPRSPYSVAGRPIPPLPQRPIANLAIVSDNYFALMHIPLAAGRAFGPGDRENAPGVCIINESLARRLFPGESALGQVMLRGPTAQIRGEIVGIARDVLTNGLSVPAPDEMYFPLRQFGPPGMAVIARTSGDPAALQPIIRASVAAVDKDQAISFFATLENNVVQSVGVQRIVASLTAVFAGLALLLSAVGLYSVLAYVVSQRTAEIGIRMALGAQPGQVVGLVMRGGLQMVAAGMVLGLAGAAGAARLIQTLLYDVQPLDPAIYGAVTALFTVVASLACLLPSWRASRIDPLRALRADS